MQGISGRLVDEFVRRPNGLSRPTPVIVALGSRGSGKTSLLDEVQARCTGQVPFARLDFAKKSTARPLEVLSELAFGLNKECPQFGRLAFPRLWLCLLVIPNLANTHNGLQARARLDELLASKTPVKHRDKVLALAQMVSDVGGLPGWVPSTADALLQGIGWVQRKRMLGRLGTMSAEWRDPGHVLVDLSRKDQGDLDDQEAVDTKVCEAFLADLRSAFTGGVNGARRTANCVVLLDNVHTSRGQSFVDALDRARQPDGPDPLVVLATSRSWVGKWWTGSGQPPRTPRQVDDELRDPPQRWPGRWYLTRLGQLTANDTASIVSERELPALQDAPSFVHRLTGGHPWAVQHVLDAVAALPPSAEPARLRDLLELPANDKGHTLADVAFTYLLKDFGNQAQARRDLITASAGRDTEFLSVPEILKSDMPYGKGALYNAVTDNLLLVPGTDTELDPWLRAVLLHKLAGRADDDTVGWSDVHKRCREYHRRLGHQAEALYHDLALGEITDVVAYLGKPFCAGDTRFDFDAAQTWMRDLDTITAAPNRLPKTVDPWVQVDERIAGIEPLGQTGMTLPRLIAALWIFNDPLGDPAETLGDTIASGFDDLAQHIGPGARLFFERAKRYRR